MMDATQIQTELTAKYAAEATNPEREGAGIAEGLDAFRVGARYDTGRGDYVWTFTVLKRTAKFITVLDELDGKERRVGVHVHAGREYALPLGSFSQAPVISADRPVRNMHLV
jgi:hypothetical protein